MPAGKLNAQKFVHFLLTNNNRKNNGKKISVSTKQINSLVLQMLLVEGDLMDILTESS